MKYSPGDQVTVRFCGRDHDGEVISHRNGYVMCRIILDPLWDYGEITASLDPESTVCVQQKYVEHADKSQ